MIEISQKPLSGKKGVILGIADEHSIAYGCAQHSVSLAPISPLRMVTMKSQPLRSSVAGAGSSDHSAL